MILNDNFEETLLPILRLKPLFYLRDGVFSDFERARHDGHKPNILVSRHSAFYDHFDLSDYQRIQNSVDLVTPSILIENIGSKISSDLGYLDKSIFGNQVEAAFEGQADHLLIHHNAEISKSACLDSRSGPIVIDAGAKVSAFSLIKGPAYIGPNSYINKALLENVIIGSTCKIGGEVSNSIFGNYSNKHHEGFIGHSLVGDWVNLGALSTTSDLKNNYGLVNLEFQGRFYSAKTMKFGSIIGDYVKTAIGSMLNTGTIIDIGSNLFANRPQQKYYAPFFWGGENTQSYELGKFLKDSKKIMARRSKELASFTEKLLTEVHGFAIAKPYTDLNKYQDLTVPIITKSGKQSQ